MSRRHTRTSEVNCFIMRKLICQVWERTVNTCVLEENVSLSCLRENKFLKKVSSEKHFYMLRWAVSLMPALIKTTRCSFLQLILTSV